MKRIGIMTLIVMLSGILLTSCSGSKSGKVKNDLTRENLKGKVKSIESRFYNVVDDPSSTVKGTEVSSRKITTQYDVKGNTTEYISLNTHDVPYPSRTYKYDERGNCIEIVFPQQDYYPESKNTDFKYDELGNQIEYKSYDMSGSLKLKWKNKFDEKGNKIESKSYTKGIFGSLTNRTTYQYDEKGNVIEMSNYLPNSSLNYKLTYKYDKFDEKGNWVSRVIQDNSSSSNQEEERQIEYYE
jgi:hypothetical protein